MDCEQCPKKDVEIAKVKGALETALDDLAKAETERDDAIKKANKIAEQAAAAASGEGDRGDPGDGGGGDDDPEVGDGRTTLQKIVQWPW